MNALKTRHQQLIGYIYARVQKLQECIKCDQQVCPQVLGIEMTRSACVVLTTKEKTIPVKRIMHRIM